MRNYRVYDWNRGISGLADYLVDVLNEEVTSSGYKNEKDHYEVTCIMAGLEKEDISITYKMENDTRILSIETLKESVSTKKGVREYEIPELADIKNITSTLKNGILTITIPKDKEKISEGKVEIK